MRLAESNSTTEASEASPEQDDSLPLPPHKPPYAHTPTHRLTPPLLSHNVSVEVISTPHQRPPVIPNANIFGNAEVLAPNAPGSKGVVVGGGSTPGRNTSAPSAPSGTSSNGVVGFVLPKGSTFGLSKLSYVGPIIMGFGGKAKDRTHR